ncbi:MAG: tetratricopeptide repeat protein [Planctomycetes bacterium]|nr:tetratricopeptide repeat protein [Planctomycetota bacterium]
MTSETAEPENVESDLTASLAEEPTFELEFDLEKQTLSFAALEVGRQSVYESLDAKRRFKNQVEALPTSGEPGRRRGLGLWVLAEYERCAAELVAHEGDDTAAFTRARALLSLARFDEALKIFQRLSDKHPNEPRPRSGLLETKLEQALAKRPEDLAKLGEELERNVLAAPGGFAETIEGLYLRGRAAELRRDLDEALDCYEKSRALDPQHYSLLTRFAHLAERTGFDDLALELYEDLLRMRPIDHNALINLGVLYEDVGRDADAASCYDTILRNKGTDERARMYLIDARAAMSMYYDEDLEKKEDRLNQILRIPITDFELSVRARNCLNKMQITTLGDLVQKTEQELLSYKNFGETSLTEIKEILHSKGLRLGMPREEAVASIEAHARRQQTGDRSDVMNKPILELALSIRARRTVETLGCLTVGDITKHSAEELLGMPNFGQTSLQELRTKLAELSLKLKGE